MKVRDFAETDTLRTEPRAGEIAGASAPGGNAVVEFDAAERVAE